MREAMSHAQTGLLPVDESLLVIGREQERMHTANAATVSVRRMLTAGMAHREPCADVCASILNVFRVLEVFDEV